MEAPACLFGPIAYCYRVAVSAGSPPDIALIAVATALVVMILAFVLALQIVNRIYVVLE
jgi:hypothetical protein